jgi:hypothetical protein
VTESPVARDPFASGVANRSSGQGAYRPEDNPAGNRADGGVAGPMTSIGARRDEDHSGDQQDSNLPHGIPLHPSTGSRLRINAAI